MLFNKTNLFDLTEEECELLESYDPELVDYCDLLSERAEGREE